jgi:hypothetical protein
VRWNAIEQRVATLLDGGRTSAELPLRADDPPVVGLLLESWRKLPSDDPRNLDIDRAAKQLQLSDAERKALRGAGATNLATLAATLVSAPQVEAHNVDAARMRALFKARRFGAAPDLLKVELSARAATGIVGSIAAALAPPAPKPQPKMAQRARAQPPKRQPPAPQRRSRAAGKKTARR